MIDFQTYLSRWSLCFPTGESPWHITNHATEIVSKKISTLNSDYIINGNVAIHKSAIIEEQVIMKSPIIISAGSFVGAHAYLRGGVFLDEHVSIGPGCEIKSSFILQRSALAHFNFVGDSLIGSRVNMEAGSVIANHHNDRDDKIIDIVIDGRRIKTNVEKFGALVGDHSKIGANAVLSPGTVLAPKSIVGRLELVNQSKGLY